MNPTAAIRILDAAANRTTEGLRVVEDYVRFVLDDKHLTRLVKELRHQLADLCNALPWPERYASRETQQDVGTQITTPTETERADPWDVCVASLQRTKQSLRSLEEYSKVDSPKLAPRFEAIRYQLYTLERSLGIGHDSRSRLSGTQLCILINGQDSIDSFRKLIANLLDTGVVMIQLRDKNLSDAKLLERARELCELASSHAKTNPSPNPSLQGRGICVIINDRPDIAAATGADGVHLGQDDLSVKDARAIVGPRKLIGVSTHSLEQARAAVLDGANYLGAGPTFPSSTKSFDDFPGLELLKQLADEIRLPTFAIGGINPENLDQVLATGITRIAISEAIASTAQLQDILKNSTPANA